MKGISQSVCPLVMRWEARSLCHSELTPMIIGVKRQDFALTHSHFGNLLRKRRFFSDYILSESSPVTDYVSVSIKSVNRIKSSFFSFVRLG